MADIPVDVTPAFARTWQAAGVPVTGRGRITAGRGRISGGVPPTQPAGLPKEKRFSNVIAKLLEQIAQDTSGAYTAKQQLAAKTAFFESGIKTLNVTPKAAWQYIKHPGISDYYWGETMNIVAQGRTDPVQGAKSMIGLQAEWARRAEQSPYMTYPSGGVAAGKAHIAPYLEAGGLVSSYEYIAQNPEYADYLYQQDPVYADSILYGFADPTGELKYGGMDERVRNLWQRATDNLQEARTKYARQYPQFPWMAWREHERGQETYPWMQQPRTAMPQTPVGTLPEWVQPVRGMTEPRW